MRFCARLIFTLFWPDQSTLAAIDTEAISITSAYRRCTKSLAQARSPAVKLCVARPGKSRRARGDLQVTGHIFVGQNRFKIFFCTQQREAELSAQARGRNAHVKGPLVSRPGQRSVGDQTAHQGDRHAFHELDALGNLVDLSGTLQAEQPFDVRGRRTAFTAKHTRFRIVRHGRTGAVERVGAQYAALELAPRHRRCLCPGGAPRGPGSQDRPARVG